MDNTFNIKIADMVFAVTTATASSGRYYEKFFTDEPAEHSIVLTQEHIEAERIKLMECGEYSESECLNASKPYLESVALLRILADYVTMHNRILMHGSSICVNGKAYIFTALSGTGKSTHTALLRNLLGEKATMINDDKPFLSVDENGVVVHGSPWMGKHGLGNNISAPLAGIFFLRRSEENILNSINSMDALSLLIAQCHRPVDPVQMMNTLEMMDSILANVPLYDFGCNMDPSAAVLSSSVMK